MFNGEQNIACKVIKRKTRKSCSAEGAYAIRYPLHITVSAIPGTLGIFCFEEKSQAEFFIRGIDPDELMVVTVEAFGRTVVPDKIAGSHAIFHYYSHLLGETDIEPYPYTPPKGTICYEKVRALE